MVKKLLLLPQGIKADKKTIESKGLYDMETVLKKIIQ
jgi:hypothetical protein